MVDFPRFRKIDYFPSLVCNFDKVIIFFLVWHNSLHEVRLASDRSIQLSWKICCWQKHVKWNIRSFSKFSKISLHLRSCSFNRYGQQQFSEQVSSIFSLFATNQLGNLYLYASCFLQLSTSRADHQNFNHCRYSYDYTYQVQKRTTEPRLETNKQQFDKIDVVWDMFGASHKQFHER